MEKGICYGHEDLELASSFYPEYKKISGLLPDSFDAVYSSPLKRCYQLAARLTDGSVKTDTRLKEMNFGDWEMQAWDDVPNAELDKWMKDYVNAKPPNGESMMDLQKRVLAWWEELQCLPYKKVATVTHGGVIRILHAKFNNILLDQSFDQFQIDYGGIMIYNSSILSD